MDANPPNAASANSPSAESKGVSSAHARSAHARGAHARGDTPEAEQLRTAQTGGEKFSVIYRIATTLVKHLGLLRVFSLDELRLRRWLERHARRRPPDVPLFIALRHRVTRRIVARRPCPSIEPRAGWQPGAPVVLFLHGGGLIFEALFAHWMVADKIVRRCGAYLALPAYPLLPQASIYEASDMVLEVYRQLCARYGHDAITILGDSAGASLALTVTLSVLRHEPELGVPHQLILLSPAQVVINDPALRAQMDALGPGDITLSPSLLDVMQRLMSRRPERDDFFATPLEQDYTGFPPTEIYYGSEELFYPLMEGFAARLNDAGVAVGTHVGEGMCHVWPYIPFAPETTRTLDEIIATIARQNGASRTS
ncbi:MAG: alpha/beta hydrolase [Coriobacteriales bacterium]|jgi:acetyl esterase/lipase|nr:alpha/beta hydrolase [Coriobacteriales bacterium]